MRCAIIIVYDGIMPSLQAQKAAAQCVADYGFIQNLDTVRTYALDESAIVSAIIRTANSESLEEKKDLPLDEISAAELVFNIAKGCLRQKDISGFGTKLANALLDAMRNGNNPKLIEAVRILTEDGAENKIPAQVRNQLCMGSQAFNMIKLIYSMVCPEHHIVFQ